MSAIAGILNFNNAPLAPGLIEGITAVMAHQGPDAIQHWRSRSVALGHCMLRTTPESINESQPLTNEDESLVLVIDGRLDNRGELQHELRLRGWPLRTSTDAELVLRAYQVWGQDSPQHLLGDFAYAVWDSRNQIVFCARDHFGARPFYYVKQPGSVAFASSDDALTRLPGVSKEPNEERIADMLAPGIMTVNPPRSWLRDVWALYPGESITFSADGNVRTTTYWQPEPGDEDAYASDEECEEAFLAVFREAVQCRLRSISEPAAMMSGGMDSASISAMVHRLLPGMPDKQFHTYSAISDQPDTCVESRCIQSLTKGPGVHAHFLSIPSLRGVLGMDDLIDTVWSSPHPVDNSIPLPAMMCRAAARGGHRVLLHGVSGDLTLDTPDRYPAHLMRSGQWRQAWYECRAASRNNTYLRGQAAFPLLLRNAWTAHAPAELKTYVRRLRLVGRDILPAASAIHPDFAKQVGWIERVRAQRNEPVPALPDARRSLARSVFRHPGLVTGLAGFGRVGARYGVETRDPWADRRVVEFFLRLPLHYKVRHGWTKYLVRTAFAPDLSPQVRWRAGKEHLGWDLICRLMDETHDFIVNTLEQGMGPLSKFADPAIVRACLKNYAHRKLDADRDLIYDLTSLTLWLQR